MPEFMQSKIAYLVSEYHKGRTIHSLAREFRCRNIKVSLALRSRNINTAGNRGIRIGNAQRGVAKGNVNRVESIRQMSSEQWAYVAGIFDGDGCITREKNQGAFRVIIVQNGMELHEWLVDALGVGGITIGKNNSNRYRIYHQKQVYEFLQGVLPHCIVKRSRVIEAIRSIKEKYKWQFQGT